jgi:hypothetical protein
MRRGQPALSGTAPMTSTGPAGRLTAYRWNASVAWYDPADHTATFLQGVNLIAELRL